MEATPAARENVMSKTTLSYRLRLGLGTMVATAVKIDAKGEVVEAVNRKAVVENGLEFLAETLGVSLSDADAILLGVEMRHEDEVDVGITREEYAALSVQWAKGAPGVLQAA